MNMFTTTIEGIALGIRHEKEQFLIYRKADGGKYELAERFSCYETERSQMKLVDGTMKRVTGIPVADRIYHVFGHICNGMLYISILYDAILSDEQWPKRYLFNIGYIMPVKGWSEKTESSVQKHFCTARTIGLIPYMPNKIVMVFIEQDNNKPYACFLTYNKWEVTASKVTKVSDTEFRKLPVNISKVHWDIDNWAHVDIRNPDYLESYRFTGTPDGEITIEDFTVR